MRQDKPTMASGYDPEWVENVRAGCLYLATVLGDLLLEHMVIVGEAGRSALVDFLIAPTSPADHPRHIKHPVSRMAPRRRHLRGPGHGCTV